MYNKTSSSVKSNGRFMKWNAFSMKRQEQQLPTKQLYPSNDEAATVIGGSSSSMVTTTPETQQQEHLETTTTPQQQPSNDAIREDEDTNINDEDKENISSYSMMNDLSDIKSVSTMNSRVVLFDTPSPLNKSDLRMQRKGSSCSRSLVSGKVFFNTFEEETETSITLQNNDNNNDSDTVNNRSLASGKVFSSGKVLFYLAEEEKRAENNVNIQHDISASSPLSPDKYLILESGGKNNQNSNNNNLELASSSGTATPAKKSEVNIEHHTIPEDSEICHSREEQAPILHKEDEEKKEDEYDNHSLESRIRECRSLASGKIFASGQVFFKPEVEEAKTENDVIENRGKNINKNPVVDLPRTTSPVIDLPLSSGRTTPTPIIPEKNEMKYPREIEIHHYPRDIEIYSSEHKKVLFMGVEEKKDDHDSITLQSHIREFISQEVRNERNDNVDYFAVGRTIFERGEELVLLGRIEEARDVFLKAQEYQKESITRLSIKLATMLHTQGLNHCDVGDKKLASLLLGAAEILKHRPNDIATIALVTQTQIGYRKVCPKRNPAFRLPRRAMDKTVRQLGLQASSMAEITKAYASTLRDCY